MSEELLGKPHNGELHTAAEVAQIAEIRDLSSVLLDRMQFAQRAGISFRGARDLYEVLGYDRALSYRHFRARYARGGIAKRIAEAYPVATWRGGVELYEDENPTNHTAFETAWEALEQRLKIWTVLQRLDTLAGLSTYAVLLIGAPGDLSTELPHGTPDSLLYLTPFSGGGGPGGDSLTNRTMGLDADCSVQTYDTDITSPRFGLPIFYQLRRTSLNAPMLQRPVHWSRILHAAEGILDNEVFGIPVLESIWNLLDDLDKVTGGGAEAFWLRANQGMHMDIAKDMAFPKPKLGEPDPLDKMREQSEEYQHGLTRWLRTRGVTVTPLGSNTANFGPPADAILTQIAGSKGIPKRILVGSEAGQLASGQDADNWNTQVSDRRTNYAGPSLLRPFVDRLILYGYLPTPKQYQIMWPVIQNLTEAEKGAGAAQWASVNATAKMTIFTADEIRNKWYGLLPGTDSATEMYKAEGAKNWAMINKIMGTTIFTQDEIRKVWYGYDPLPPSERIPIAGPEKVAATTEPTETDDVQDNPTDGSNTEGSPTTAEALDWDRLLLNLESTVDALRPIPDESTSSLISAMSDAIERKDPTAIDAIITTLRATGAPPVPDPDDEELIRVLKSAIETNNTEVLDKLLGTERKMQTVIQPAEAPMIIVNPSEIPTAPRPVAKRLEYDDKGRIVRIVPEGAV